LKKAFFFKLHTDGTAPECQGLFDLGDGMPRDNRERMAGQRIFLKGGHDLADERPRQLMRQAEPVLASVLESKTGEVLNACPSWSEEFP